MGEKGAPLPEGEGERKWDPLAPKKEDSEKDEGHEDGTSPTQGPSMLQKLLGLQSETQLVSSAWHQSLCLQAKGQTNASTWHDATG